MNRTHAALTLALLIATPVVAAAAGAPRTAITTKSARGAATPRAASALPFVADDYTRAVAEARARKVPLFIEAWAPW